MASWGFKKSERIKTKTFIAVIKRPLGGEQLLDKIYGEMSLWETGAISTGMSHASPQVTSTLTSRTIRPEGSDGNGSNDTLMEFDWNAHLSVPKMSTMHFLPFARVTVAPKTSSTREKNSR